MYRDRVFHETQWSRFGGGRKRNQPRSGGIH